MIIIKKFLGLFAQKRSNAVPLVIIRKESENADVTEYRSIEEAIADLEKDPSVSKDKIAAIRASLKSLKNKTTIKIKNGELVR